MRLREFVANHPGCAVGGPDLRRPALWIAAGVGGVTVCLALARAAVLAGDGWSAAIAALMPAIPMVWLAWEGARRALERWRMVRDGVASFAVSDERLLLIGASGRSVMLDLAALRGLELHDDQPRLYARDDAQPLVYRAMFDLFDEPEGAPDPKRFFALVAPRLEAAVPEARIVRH